MDFGTNQILITGANGWLGRSLIDCLLNGIENSGDIEKPNKKLKIKCLILKDDDALNIKRLNNISIVKGDVTVIEDCERFTDNSEGAILFHCAGIIHPKKTLHFFDINVMLLWIHVPGLGIINLLHLRH